MSKYENALKNTKVENGNLIKNDEVILSIGDEFTDALNDFRSYKCTSMDLHFLRFEKISVGTFEQEKLGKCREVQTVHFVENELNWKKNK